MDDSVDWADLPDELWLWIFSFLPEKELISCWRLNRRLRRLSQDRSLCRALQEYRLGKPLEEIFLGACSRGEIHAIDFLISLLTQPEKTPKGGHLTLWILGLEKAIEYGHLPIVKKLLSYGALFSEDFLLKCCHQHLEMTEFLLGEFPFRRETLDKALSITFIHERNDLTAVLFRALNSKKSPAI